MMDSYSSSSRSSTSTSWLPVSNSNAWSANVGEVFEYSESGDSDDADSASYSSLRANWLTSAWVVAGDRACIDLVDLHSQCPVFV
jgi:hypothetical protein